MLRSLLDYHLPEELIASHPPEERDGARLLVLDEAATTDRAVRDLDELVPRGALLVVNDTRVIPARLIGHKVGSGGKVEVLLVRPIGDASAGGKSARWRALGRASKPIRVGAKLVFEAKGEAIDAEIIDSASAGVFEVMLTARGGGSLDRALDAVGHMPLPPYMHRPDQASDRDRYQTVYARAPGAVAAPTAGLHLSQALLDRLQSRGVVLAAVTLHVGLGTFQPVTVEDLDDHPMHSEWFSIPEPTVRAVADARGRGAPVVAVGTTAVRALESGADPAREGHVRALEGETRLLIQPGYRFRVVDQLLTNFHLPQSTLLALVAAFAGRERVLAAYAHAVAARYRFFSYGDAMLIRTRLDSRAET